MKDKKMGGLMKNHGNTSQIKSDNEKYDMNRLNKMGMEKKGYSEKAFAYKY